MVTIEGCWDRRFLFLTEDHAIQLTLEVSQSLLDPGFDPTLSRAERAYCCLTQWRGETAPEKMREIKLATPRATSGSVVLEAVSWPAVGLLIRSLTKAERLIVQNGQALVVQARLAAAMETSPERMATKERPVAAPKPLASEEQSEPASRGKSKMFCESADRTRHLPADSRYMMRPADIRHRLGLAKTSSHFRKMKEVATRWLFVRANKRGKQPFYDMREFNSSWKPEPTASK